MFFINPDFLQSLSPADREAISAASGERLSAMAGRVWGGNDDAGLAAARAAGNQIVQASAAEQKKFRDLVQGMDEQWLQKVADRNVDAAAALRELRDIARSY